MASSCVAPFSLTSPTLSLLLAFAGVPFCIRLIPPMERSSNGYRSWSPHRTVFCTGAAHHIQLVFCTGVVRESDEQPWGVGLRTPLVPRRVLGTVVPCASMVFGMLVPVRASMWFGTLVPFGASATFENKGAFAQEQISNTYGLHTLFCLLKRQRRGRNSLP